MSGDTRLYTHFTLQKGEQINAGKHTNDFVLRQTKINNDFTQLIKHGSLDLGQESGRSEPNQLFPPLK